VIEQGQTQATNPERSVAASSKLQVANKQEPTGNKQHEQQASSS
jgi:hypothetical protein